MGLGSINGFESSLGSVAYASIHVFHADKSTTHGSQQVLMKTTREPFGLNSQPWEQLTICRDHD